MEPVYQVLALAACYGDHTNKQEVLSITLDLLSRFTARPFSETTLAHLGLLVPAVSHTLCTARKAQALPMRGLLIAIDAVMELLRAPRPSHDLMLHGFSLLVSAAWRCEWIYMQEKTSALALMATLLRSGDIAIRALLVQTYFFFDAQEEDVPAVNLTLTPIRLERLPPVLRQVVEEYGTERCEVAQMLHCRRLVLNMVRRLRLHHDFRKFGTEMAAFLVEHGRHLDDVLAGFASWQGALCPVARHLNNALSASVKTLRRREDVSKADVLHLEYLYLTARSEAAVYANIVIKRDPQNAWAHFSLFGVYEGDEDKVQTCRRTLLDLPELPSVIRLRMQSYLLSALTRTALAYFLDGSPAELTKRTDAIQNLEDALDLANAFVSEAPPDLPALLDVLDYHILITLILRGTGPGKGLKNIQVRPHPCTTLLSMLISFVSHLSGCTSVQGVYNNY